MDTVLIGGFAVLTSVAVIWFILSKLDNIEMPDNKKRLLTYFLFAVFVMVVIVVMKWHSENYKQNFKSSQVLQAHQSFISLFG